MYDVEAPEIVIVVFCPLQTIWLAILSIIGVGFTVIVKLIGIPLQTIPLRVKEGVTVIVPTIGLLPSFSAEKEGMSPLPLLAKPIAAFEFVQL